MNRRNFLKMLGATIGSVLVGCKKEDGGKVDPLIKPAVVGADWASGAGDTTVVTGMMKYPYVDVVERTHNGIPDRYIDDVPPISADIAEIWNVFYGAWAYLTQDGETGWFLWYDEKWHRTSDLEVWSLDDEWIHWDVSKMGIYRNGELVVSLGQLPDLSVGSRIDLVDLPDFEGTLDVDVTFPAGRCISGFGTNVWEIPHITLDAPSENMPFPGINDTHEFGVRVDGIDVVTTMVPGGDLDELPDNPNLTLDADFTLPDGMWDGEIFGGRIYSSSFALPADWYDNGCPPVNSHTVEQWQYTSGTWLCIDDMEKVEWWIHVSGDEWMVEPAFFTREQINDICCLNVLEKRGDSA